MNISTRTRIAGTTATLGLLISLAACGSDTVSDTDPGNQPAAKPAVASDSARHQSADSAERQAAAEKARQDRASALRWERGQHEDSRLGNAGLSGQN